MQWKSIELSANFGMLVALSKVKVLKLGQRIRYCVKFEIGTSELVTLYHDK